MTHDLPASEFVRKRILALVRATEIAGEPAVSLPLAPLIERPFPVAAAGRCCHQRAGPCHRRAGLGRLAAHEKALRT